MKGLTRSGASQICSALSGPPSQHGLPHRKTPQKRAGLPGMSSSAFDSLLFAVPMLAFSA